MIRAVICAASIAALAPAERPKYAIAPPAKYDRPYTGHLTIKVVASREALKTVCPIPSNRTNHLGCAFPHAPGGCIIFLVPDKVFTAFGWTRAGLLRHELAHCNGWPAHHPPT